MIELNRSKTNKWIFQKNISSKSLIKAYLKVVSEEKNISDKASIKQSLISREGYRGRSDNGSLSTMGVRFSQMCFYMFGYRDLKKPIFIPTQMTSNMLENNDEVHKNMLVNLFSIQFPHPFSKTPKNFCIYAGRLLIQLLTEKRIDSKLYCDEFIWFLPFIESIDSATYESLVESIILYRTYSYRKKLGLFQSVHDYEDLFANCAHEFFYYFRHIFEQFHVLESVDDYSHNDGNLFKFKHGNTNTYRHDGIGSCIPGYIKLNDSLVDYACRLIEKFPISEKPICMNRYDIFSKEEWITNLYDIAPLQYLTIIFPDTQKDKYISDILNSMTNAAIAGSVDGKDFENSLRPVMMLFDLMISCDLISGSGHTDLLCTLDIVSGKSEMPIKINIEAKSRTSSNLVNVKRINRHMDETGALYCIVIAPRFPIGTILDLEDENIVALKSDVLAKYLAKECMANPNGTADYLTLHNIILNNLGSDVSDNISNITDEKYGYQLVSF